jgi:hypothetical protein
MEPTKELADAIEHGRFERAMAMSPEEKFFAGGQLFEFACRVTMAGIRDQYPGVSEDEALKILRQRMEKSRQYEERQR